MIAAEKSALPAGRPSLSISSASPMRNCASALSCEFGSEMMPLRTLIAVWMDSFVFVSMWAFAICMKARSASTVSG